MADDVDAVRNILIRPKHHIKCVSVDDNVGAQHVEQGEQIVVTRLQGSRRQHHHRSCMVTQILHTLVSESLFRIGTAITNGMRFVNNDQVEMRRRIQVLKAVSALTPRPPLKGLFVQDGIRDDGTPPSAWPDTAVPIHVRERLRQSFPIHWQESLIEAPHLHLPLTFSHQWLGADNYDVAQWSARLQLFDDKAGLDSLTNANAVRDQNARLIRPNELQRRSKLIGHKVDTRRIQRIKSVPGRMVQLIGRQPASKRVRVQPFRLRYFHRFHLVSQKRLRPVVHENGITDSLVQ